MDKVDIAFERLKTASRIASYTDQPLMVCYSGGKDSEVIVDLAIKSKVPIEIVNSHTSVDAPETVYHIRSQMHRWADMGIKCKIEYPMYKGRRATMWSLIVDKKLPPTRKIRYCCSVLKEASGEGRAIVTGVRWSESKKRKETRGIYEELNTDIKKRVIINNDNDVDRMEIEHCRLQGKTVHNVIVDWTDRDVWDYIQSEQLQINPLYNCGFDRVGCIGCPMAGKKRSAEFKRYPKYRDMYIRAMQRSVDVNNLKFSCGEEMFEWWMEKDPMQLSMFAEDNEWLIREYGKLEDEFYAGVI